MNQLAIDNKLIEDLGGPMAVARLVGRDDHEGRQLVGNWKTRGIPQKIWNSFGKKLLKEQARALRKLTKGKQ